MSEHERTGNQQPDGVGNLVEMYAQAETTLRQVYSDPGSLGPVPRKPPTLSATLNGCVNNWTPALIPTMYVANGRAGLGWRIHRDGCVALWMKLLLGADGKRTDDHKAGGQRSILVGPLTVF